MKRKTTKKSARRFAAAIILMRLLLSASALAVDPNAPPPPMLQTITEMRAKQEAEENNTIRVIQSTPLQVQPVCLPVEQARQRLRDVGNSDQKVAGSVTVEAGHGEVAVESNEGDINNSVNVQVVNQNERVCL